MHLFSLFAHNSPLLYSLTAMMLTGTNLNTSLDLDALFAGIVDIILKMGSYIGGALAVGGVLQLLLSQMNDQPENKTAALRVLVVAGALMGMRGLIQLVGII